MGRSIRNMKITMRPWEEVPSMVRMIHPKISHCLYTAVFLSTPL
jgi:hypothetical protein